MASHSGFKVSRQRPRTNTSSLRTNGESQHVLDAMRLSINISNAKAKRTMKRKRSTSDLEEVSACQDDYDVDDEAKSEDKVEPRRKKKTKKRKAKKNLSSDEGVLTAKKSAKHNKDLHKVLSSSIPHTVAESKDSSKPASIDEYDAVRTHNNMEAFNQFIINEGTLMQQVSQEEAKANTASQIQISEHDTFNLGTHSWYEATQILRKKLCFDATPISDDPPFNTSSSAAASSSSRRKRKGNAKTNAKTGAVGNETGKKHAEKSLPIVPANYNTSMTAAFNCDVSEIYKNVLSKSPYWDKMYSEDMRMALREGAGYDLTNAHECPRDHVNKMLVTPYGNFNECANAQNCKARVIYHLGHGLIGYRSPSEFEDLASKPMSSVPLCKRLCYICHLALIHETLLHQQNRGASCMTVNTPFMHRANQIGEYHQRHMIPHSIRTGDADVQTPMVDVPKAGTQNSGGLVVPVRMWVRSEYVRSTSKPVRYLDEKGHLREETRPGLEEIVGRFIQHDTNKPPVSPVKPYIYTRFLLEHRYDTWDILRYEFAPKVGYDEFTELNANPRVRSRGSTGVARLKERLKSSNDVIILPIYWALTIIGTSAMFKLAGNLRGMEPFPFHAIFQKDIRHTAQRIEDILTGGRIYLRYLRQRAILNFIIEGEVPLRAFRSQLDPDSAEHASDEDRKLSEFYQPRRLYLAYILRDEILRTLRVVYPNSTAYNDPCAHGRLEIADQWNREHYGALFEDRIPLDVEVSDEQLDRICALEVPHRYFASDVDFVKSRTEIVERENPRKELCDYYSTGCDGVADVYECNVGFTPFDSLRALFASNQIALSIALKVIDRRQLREVLFCAFPDRMFKSKFAELSATHSIAMAVAFRISLAQKIYEHERAKLEVLKSHKTDIDNSFLRMKGSREASLAISATVDECVTRMNQLTSFIYSHFALIERARLYELCSDAQFYLPVESPTDNRFLTHYEDVEPFDTVSVHEGDLPDLSYLVTCVNFVVNTKEGSKGNEHVQPVLLSVFRKMCPKCCQSRNAPDKHISACETNVSYLDLVRNAYRMTMMGGYRHTSQIPALKTALHIYSNTSIDGYDRVEFMEQQRRYPHFFLLCMTEMLMFFTRQAPAYHDFILLNYPTYTRYEHSVLHKADLVRRMHSEMSMEQIETFISGLEIFINEEPSSSARSEFHVFRPVRVDPIKKLVGHVQNINNIRHRQGYHRPEMPDIMQRAVVHLAYTVRPNRDIDLVQLMLEMNKFYVGDVPLQDWQRNVKRCTTYIIPWVLDMMECAEADDVIEMALNYIPPTDWEIFDLLINTLDVHYSVNILNLPAHIRRQQEEALKRRSDIEELGPDSNSINFANCCHVKTSHDTTADMASPHISFGQNKTCHKIYAGHDVCARKRRAIVERKINRNDKGQYTRIQNAMSLGDTNEIMRMCQELAKRPPDWQKHRRYRYQPDCGEEPIARYYPFTGHVVQYTNIQGTTDAYSICTNCGSTAGFSRRLFDVNGFSCIACEEALVDKRNTPRCVACCCFIDIQAEEGTAKWKRFVVFNDSMGLITYQYEVHYICANNGCYDLQTSKINDRRVFEDRFVVTSTSDLQKGRRVSTWKSELEIRMGFTNVHENIAYFYQNMALPNSRRGSRKGVPKPRVIKI